MVRQTVSIRTTTGLVPFHLCKTTALPHTVIQLLTMCGCWKRICSTKTSDPYVVLTTYRRLHWASDEKLLSQRFQTKPVKEVRAAQ